MENRLCLRWADVDADGAICQRHQDLDQFRFEWNHNDGIPLLADGDVDGLNASGMLAEISKLQRPCELAIQSSR